ncbi:hypothetical protein EWI07_02735 [Sporolactobacillus sp. THM7-4]|nr:hypothetical protein EWI07_02735 [Sporolactobacillus sp. THM7-4]
MSKFKGRSVRTVAEVKTNDAIKRFKLFLRKHPEIVENVRKNDKKWRDVFDDWVIFGESHEIWKSYGVDLKGKSGQRSPFSWNKIIDAVDKIDTKDWQERLNTISGALTSIQSLIGQFQGNKQNVSTNSNGQNTSGGTSSQGAPGGSGQQGPFFFRRD